MRIAIASDHAAVSLKSALADWMREADHDVLDLGTHGDASVDYPDYGDAIARALADGRAERGVALCGSGIGIAIAVPTVIPRAAARWSPNHCPRRWRAPTTTPMRSRWARG